MDTSISNNSLSTGQSAMTKEPIQVVCASNNNFVVMLVVLLKSIQKTNTDNREIIFYIIDDRIKELNKQKIEKSVQDARIKIKWIPLNESLLSKIKFPNDYSTYPKNIYSRLLIEYFIPESVKKAIYLDSDMMLMTPISKLWEIPLDGNIAGAVMEPNVKTMDCPWSGVKNHDMLGIPAKAKYFNSGLLLIDVEKWRKANVAQAVVNCVEQNKKYAGQPDQYGLNVVLYKRWKELSPAWNHYATMESNGIAPYNIHFVIRKPIYTYYNGLDSYRKIFYQHLQETEWRNFTPIGEFKRKLIKVNNILEKVF